MAQEWYKSWAVSGRLNSCVPQSVSQANISSGCEQPSFIKSFCSILDLFSCVGGVVRLESLPRSFRNYLWYLSHRISSCILDMPTNFMDADSKFSVTLHFWGRARDWYLNNQNLREAGTFLHYVSCRLMLECAINFVFEYHFQCLI